MTFFFYITIVVHTWPRRDTSELPVWQIANLIVRIPCLYRIYMDERKIDLNDDEAALWRYFYRHSGLSQFKALLSPTLKVLTFKKGEEIPTKKFIYVILDGLVEGDIRHKCGKEERITLRSGELFPLEAMAVNYMPQETVFSRSWLTPKAHTDVKIFAIPTETSKAFSRDHNARDAWMTMLIVPKSEIAERPFRGNEIDSKEDDSIFLAPENELLPERNPIFDPLEEEEEPYSLLAGPGKGLSNALSHLLLHTKMSFCLPWPFGHCPTGLRRSSNRPTSRWIYEKQFCVIDEVVIFSLRGA